MRYSKTSRDILLGFIKTVDFINEQDCILSVHLLPVAGALQYFPKHGYIGQYAAGALKPAVGGLGYDFRQGGFSAAGRSV